MITSIFLRGIQFPVPKLLQLCVCALLIALRLLTFNAWPFSPLFSLELNSAHIAFLTTCSQGEKVILLKITFGKRKGEIPLSLLANTNSKEKIFSKQRKDARLATF